MLAGALPELVAAERKLASAAGTYGITYAIAKFGGVRSQADTVKALAYRDQDYRSYVIAAKNAGAVIIPIDGAWDHGKLRKIAPFGSSYHNYGAAFDVRVVTKPATMTVDQAIARLGALSSAAGLHWGASFGDQWHFQWNVPIGTARSAWETTGKAPGQSTVSIVGAIGIALLLWIGVRKWIM
jgi:hypothetical protein